MTDQLNQSMNKTPDYGELSIQCEQNSLSMLIKNPAGRILYAYGNSGMMSQRLDDIFFGRNLNSGSATIVISQQENYTLQKFDNETGSIDYIEIWGFLNNGNSFLVRSSYQSIQNNISQSLLFFSLIFLVMLIIAAVIIFFIINYYFEPIRRLADFAQNLNEGVFGTTYEYKHFRMDEIGVLGQNISEIGTKLENVIAELKTSNLNLENELKAKTELEEQRKKYMSDVSHELKTPIALISGYAEGLKEGISEDPEDREYYCDVIIDEAEKMNLLVKRLSTLNQLENGSSAVSLERFDLIKVIDGFLNTMSMIIEEKDINIYFDNSYHEYVWSDEFFLEEALVNYFNNAMNHLDENKIIKIFVLKKEDGNVRITIYNTGEHIPAEELDRLWGKFYKVDKARTREYGGSGLGLSIVKAIADSLNQQCGVYNMEGGVAFWIEVESAEIPKNEEEKLLASIKNKAKPKFSNLPIWKSAAGRIIKDAAGKAEKKSSAEKKPKKTKNTKTTKNTTKPKSNGNEKNMLKQFRDNLKSPKKESKNQKKDQEIKENDATDK
ncbi:MAG: HAMP domain-containing histidine kinase [Lachnospiraceae bacterium]|nr:HAMP domain-containing histidine kinase [Lachnospiraceae bacterium]